MASGSAKPAEKNSAKWTQGLDLMTEGLTDSEIASRLGVGAASVWRWRQDPEFAVRLGQRRDATIKMGRARLDKLGSKAIDILEAALDDDDAPMAVRVRAASDILDRIGLGAPVVSDSKEASENESQKERDKWAELAKRVDAQEAKDQQPAPEEAH